jgi:transposase
LFCFEHTGWYCLELSWFLQANTLSFQCASPLHLKRSMGFRRGKSDRADAFDIAQYAWLNRENLSLSKAPSKVLTDLQCMIALRDQLVKQSTALKNQKQGMKEVALKTSSNESLVIIKQCLKFKQKQISCVEKRMLVLVLSIPEYVENYKLLCSIKGIGFV